MNEKKQNCFTKSVMLIWPTSNNQNNRNLKRAIT